jgi:hypothetical protein
MRARTAQHHWNCALPLNFDTNRAKFSNRDENGVSRTNAHGTSGLFTPAERLSSALSLDQPAPGHAVFRLPIKGGGRKTKTMIAALALVLLAASPTLAASSHAKHVREGRDAYVPAIYLRSAVRLHRRRRHEPRMADSRVLVGVPIGAQALLPSTSGLLARRAVGSPARWLYALASARSHD